LDDYYVSLIITTLSSKFIQRDCLPACAIKQLLKFVNISEEQPAFTFAAEVRAKHRPAKLTPLNTKAATFLCNVGELKPHYTSPSPRI
jgi:hypothetical protein